MAIFKAYDIRGVYPSQLDEQTAYKIGRALVVFLKAKRLLVARDCRVSSPSLTIALVEGITDQGADVLDVGLSSSPMFNFCVGKSDVDGGVMVTASHNPKEYNGFKMAKRGAVAMSGETGIKDVERLVLEDTFPKTDRKGTIERAEMLSKYADHVVSFAKGIKPLKVVIDAGNGMGGLVAPPVFKQLSVEMIPMWFTLDGRFPNRDANPSKEENVTVLRARVIQEKADLGIALDGDGDRVIFVDEKGGFLPSDLSTGLIAEEVKARYKDTMVLYDLRSSRAVKEHLDRLGLKSLRTRVGHSFIKAAMREHQAAFAGELSGHFYFKDHFFCDSGLIASMFMLSLLSRTAKPLSELAKPLRVYSSTGEVNFTVSDTTKVIQAVKERFKDGKIDELDGVTSNFPDWWLNVRASNTEPLVRMIVEAKDDSTLKAKREEVEAVIRRFVIKSEKTH